MQTIILNLNHYDWFVSKIDLYPKRIHRFRSIIRKTVSRTWI